MDELDWKAADSHGATLQALAGHRLLPVAGLLASRGLLRGDLVPVAERLAARDGPVMAARARVEDEVMAALVGAGVPFLVLKGALLARTVYPAPEARIRTDIDVLVDPGRVEDARGVLGGLGFAPSYEVEGGPPMTQAQWVRAGDSPVHAVDVHWDLFNRPVLKHRFEFQALASRAMVLPGVAGGARGLSAPDALLHACAHYYGHHRGEFRPDQWLLDLDLLWRAMGAEARGQAVELGAGAGVASLVGAGLARAQEVFQTPVDGDVLEALAERGRGERSARLVRPPRVPALAAVRSAFDERGWKAKLVHLWRLGFPPVAHIRRKYPGAGRWGVPWLYVRRIWGGLKK